MKEIAAVDCWRLFSPRFPFKMIDLTSLTCPVLGLFFFNSLPKRCFKQTPNRQRDIKEPQFRCDNNKIIFHFIYFHIKAFICGGLQQLFSLTFWKLKTKNVRFLRAIFHSLFTSSFQSVILPPSAEWKRTLFKWAHIYLSFIRFSYFCQRQKNSNNNDRITTFNIHENITYREHHDIFTHVSQFRGRLIPVCGTLQKQLKLNLNNEHSQ